MMRGPTTIKENTGWSAPVDAFAYTAFCSMPGSPRGVYDEEIDLVATGSRRPGETALRRAAQEILDRDYAEGMTVRRIERTW
jgi:hypothetical protein